MIQYSKEIIELLDKKKKTLSYKRIFDVFFSFMGIIVLFPFFLLIYLLILVTSKGNPIFIQERAGKDGKIFHIWKFRTMVDRASSKGRLMTVGDDPRITKVGKILRKLKIDEIPQLINVLKGDMSFVGPRPLVPYHISLYTEVQKQILCVKPGITDLASISFRKESEMLANSSDPDKTYLEEIIPRKVELNMVYIRNISLWNDLRLIFRTVFSLFKL